MGVARCDMDQQLPAFNRLSVHAPYPGPAGAMECNQEHKPRDNAVGGVSDADKSNATRHRPQSGLPHFLYRAGLNQAFSILLLLL